MHMNILEIVEKTFDEYCGEFSKILGEEPKNGCFAFKPWLNAWKDENRRSIHEANQVSKFMETYKRIAPNPSTVLTWMELPIFDNCKLKTHRIDGFIVDNERKILFFLEAKRLSRKSNYESLNDDIRHLYDFGNKESKKLYNSFKGLNLLEYKAYAICLVDIWKDKSAWTREMVEKRKYDDNFSNNRNRLLGNKLKEVYSDYFLGYYLMPFYESGR